MYMVKCDSWLKVSKEVKDNIVHIDLCTYGQSYLLLANLQILTMLNPRQRKRKPLNKNGDFWDLSDWC